MDLYSGCLNYFLITDLVTDKTTKYNLPNAGLISAFAFHPTTDFYLLGTYNRTTHIMDYRSNKPEISLNRQSGGINNLLFHSSGIHFISAGRKDNEVLLWDSRQLDEPVYSFYRNNPTNQRIIVSLADNNLFCGNHVSVCYDI
jgi:WD40 repeat protein